MPRALAPAVAAVTVLALAAAACSNPTPVGPSVPVFTTAPGATVPASTTAPATTAAASSTTAGPATTTLATTTSTSIPSLDDLDLRLVEVAAGFDRPLFVTAPPGDGRLFVVEQGGRIRVLRPGDPPATFLDLAGLLSAAGNEQGLLGLAFHPDYPADPRFYVDYTDRGGSTMIAEYRVSPDPDAADPGSARVLLTVPQPYPNHNGGMLAFGPDGHLYVGMGDGGGAGDPERTAQDPASLLGSILRLAVDGDLHPLPPNPWAGDGGAPEVWAKGLRNPWRFSFDGDLIYIGDVGQGDWEEIDVAHFESQRLDFGWSTMEGSHCYREAGCDSTGLQAPVLEYSHEGGKCSVTGGYVYRGEAIPELAGAYFYGDFCSGMVASFRRDAEGLFDLRDWTGVLGAVPGLTSFGLDGFGEIYLVARSGEVYRLERA